jgi:hypothetical protein
MPLNSTQHTEQSHFPVSVIMAHEQITMGQWRVPRWSVVGVIAGEHAEADEGGRLIHDDAGKQQYIWSGFEIRLYQDASESYWLNLVGQQPSLFIVCREDPVDGGCAPLVVTANYDEAGAYMEADATVMAAPMPPEIYRWLEQYVVENFRPVEGKSRKREAWFDNEQPQMPPRGRRH